MRIPTIFLVTLFAASTVCAGSEVTAKSPQAPETDLLCVGYGPAGIADARQFHCGSLEWRSRPLWRGFAPYLIGSWRETGASYVGAGVAYIHSLSPKWTLTASSGPGYFEREGDFDLGSHIEFASTLELAYRFESGRRLALGVGHISNAGAGRVNPGSEYLRLSIQFPIRWW